jgi:hypothetical protein
MGYTTDFSGSFQLDKPLTKDQAAYLKMFAETRRMKRDPAKITTLPSKKDAKPINPTLSTGPALWKENSGANQPCLDLLKRLGLPLGPEGAYYCGTGDFGQDSDASVLNSNGAPQGQPGLWCQWVPSENRKEIEWNGGEKFYEYVEWIKYIIENFLKPWGRTLNGTVNWVGEDSDDRGKITIVNNIVSTSTAQDTENMLDVILEQKAVLPALIGLHPLLDEKITRIMGENRKKGKHK